MGIKEEVSAPRSSWQNPYVERVIGSIRRECLDHVVVLGRAHLLNLLSSYVACYNEDQTHYSLEKDTPDHRPVEKKPGKNARVIAIPKINGLHHRYSWKKAA